MDWDLTSLCISIGIFDLAPSSLVFRLAVVFQFRPRMQIRFQALHAAVKNMILNGSKLELAALGFPPKKTPQRQVSPGGRAFKQQLRTKQREQTLNRQPGRIPKKVKGPNQKRKKVHNHVGDLLCGRLCKSRRVARRRCSLPTAVLRAHTLQGFCI